MDTRAACPLLINLFTYACTIPSADLRGPPLDRIEVVRNMMTSHGNIFRVAGPLWGEFIVHRWNPLTKASDAKLWCFLCLNKRLSKQSRRRWFRVHYDVTVMSRLHDMMAPAPHSWVYTGVNMVTYVDLGASGRYIARAGIIFYCGM